MTEREMRSRIDAACARLDRIRAQVHRSVRKVLLPATLGAGLALGGGACGGDRTVSVDAEVAADVTPEPVVAYGHPMPDAGPLPADAAPPEADAVVPPEAPAYGAPYPPPTPADAAVADDGDVDGPMNGLRYGTPFP